MEGTMRPLVSSGPGLTLHQKKARLELALYLKKAPRDENAAAMYLNTWKSEQHQVDLAMKLVNSPLHHSQDTGPLFSQMELHMIVIEERMIKSARKKMPGLWMLLEHKLMCQFGPLFKPFVSQLVLNIMLQILMTWQHHVQLTHIYHIVLMNSSRPTEESIKKALVNKFALATLPDAPVEEMIDELVKKMELAFADASAAEDALMRNISVAKGTLRPLVSSGPGLTLHQKKARLELDLYLKKAPRDENAAAMYLNTWKSEQQQVDLAMKLVNSPLHHSQDPGPLFSQMEPDMIKIEERMIKSARKKMPGLWMLLQHKLMCQFGPLFKPFVSQLVLNIMLQILVTRQHHVQLTRIIQIVLNRSPPTEESIKKALVNKFALATLPDAPVEEMIDELVKKMELAFADASAAEDALITK